MLVEELSSAAGQGTAANLAASAIGKLADEGEDDDGWEDVNDGPDIVSTPGLLPYLEGSGIRQPDDETQRYLTEFFHQVDKDNTADFWNWCQGLNEEEKGKLKQLIKK